MLAIDLYNKAYLGGDRPVKEVDREFSGTCGENAWLCAPAHTEAVRGRAPRRRTGDLLDAPCEHRRGAIHQPQSQAHLTDDIYDIKAELAPQPGELVIYKERASAFFGTPLIAHLQGI